MEILVPLGFFAMIAAIVIVPMYLGHKGRLAKMDLVKQALDKGQPVDSALLESLYETERPKPPQDRARRTLGSGVILTALAIGLAIAAYFQGDLGSSGVENMGVAAAIVGCLGAGFILLAIVDYASKKKDPPSMQE